MQRLIFEGYLQRTICKCRKLDSSEATGELPCTKGRMQKRTLVHNIAIVGKTLSGEYLKNIMRISSEYLENIGEISGGGMELGERV